MECGTFKQLKIINMSEIVNLEYADTIQAISRTELDIQVNTAKAYPRDLKKVLKQIEDYATMDEETAGDCFYTLRRAKGDDTNIIEGVSVRLSEIIAGAWGNLRVQTRIMANDGKTITCQGICHDLETNLAVSVEVKRRITDKKGNTYSEDMQVVTGNAASAIAFRNAVLKVVPKAVTKNVITRIKKIAMGGSMETEEKRQAIVAYFAKIGVSKEKILEYLGLNSIREIGKEQVFELRAVANAIKEGTTTIKECFFSEEKTLEKKKNGLRANNREKTEMP
jgi:hypothetical protein